MGISSSLSREIERVAETIPHDRVMALAPYDAYRLAREHAPDGPSEKTILEAIVEAVKERGR
jgi:hypothetical protein